MKSIFTLFLALLMNASNAYAQTQNIDKHLIFDIAKNADGSILVTNLFYSDPTQQQRVAVRAMDTSGTVEISTALCQNFGFKTASRQTYIPATINPIAAVYLVWVPKNFEGLQTRVLYPIWFHYFRPTTPSVNLNIGLKGDINWTPNYSGQTITSVEAAEAIQASMKLREVAQMWAFSVIQSFVCQN